MKKIDRYVDVRLEGCLVFRFEQGSRHARRGVDVTATIIRCIFPVEEEVVLGGSVGGSGGSGLRCGSKYKSKRDDLKHLSAKETVGRVRDVLIDMLTNDAKQNDDKEQDDIKI